MRIIKILRKLTAFVLVLGMCCSYFLLNPGAAHASEAIGFKAESQLEITENAGKQLLVGLPEKTTLGDLQSMIYSYSTVRAVGSKGFMSNDDTVSTGTVLLCGDATLQVVVKGDTSGDGAVDVTDLLRIKKYFLSGFQLDGLFLLAADVSGNGTVDTTDYLQIKQYFLNQRDLYAGDSTAPVYPLSMIRNGTSSYVIAYGNSTEQVAAYALQEALYVQTGVTLQVRSQNSLLGSNVIYMRNINPRNVGNYGYGIEVSQQCVSLYASTPAGFDNAIARLISDCADGQMVVVPSNYSIAENKTWETNYVLQASDYKADYVAGMFYNDKNDAVAYVSNAMWHMFGAIDDGQNLVYRFGNEPTWFEWMSEKLAWSTDQPYINELKGKICTFPQTSTGYMWSWSTYPYWKVDNCYSIHYDGTFRYISAVYDILCWEGNTQFLYQTDPDTAAGEYADVDASRNRTVLQKTEACMDYILSYLKGNQGYIQLTKESTYLNADGSKRFDYVKDTNGYCWDNTGKDGSTASNYWDNLCFGNYDGYSNALFYNALHSMAGIYRMLGGAYIAKAEELEALAVTVKRTFNEKFWSNQKGRYIACIDTDGRHVDYGLTFHNFEIMKYGLADPAKAKEIFSWVDGDRIIAGEDRTGADIFSYGRIMEQVEGTAAQEIAKHGFRLAAVTNTVAINNAENQQRNVAWWHGPAGINVWGSAAYGKHLENGGYIFYPVFYELMARTKYEGAQSTTERLCEISKVYEYNRLISDAAAIHSTNWLEGMIGEYPENGLVPTAYLYSFLGISAEYDGLHIAPAFNEVYEYMGVKKLSYGGSTYDVRVNRNGSCTIIPASGTARMQLHYKPAKFQTLNYRLTINYADGSVSAAIVTPDANGVLHFRLDDTAVDNVTIVPILN